MTRRQPATNTRFFDRRKTSPEQFSTNFHDTGISLFALPHFGHGISLLLCPLEPSDLADEPLIAGVIWLRSCASAPLPSAAQTLLESLGILGIW
jgi:hypothetical protein